MLNFLTSIGDTIIALVNLVISSIEALITVITHIPTYITFLTVSIGYLPTLIIPFAVTTVSLYAIYFVIGRNTK